MRRCGAAPRIAAAACVAALLVLPGRDASATPATRDVSDDAGLRAALASAGPGTEIAIAPGTYRGGVWVEGLRGTAAKPVLIRAKDPADPPVFLCGAAAGGDRPPSEGWHLTDCSHLTLRGIVVRGAPGNGINADDGGTPETPAGNLTLEDLRVEDTGPRGNHDAMKLSGIVVFTVRRCVFAGWGGSAIDMVGCRDGVIEACEFRGREGFSQDSGVQAKGASRDVAIRGCFFLNAGQRGVNLGGSTGLAFFRPESASKGPWEAERISVEGCRFSGGTAPVAFVSSSACRVVRNTIHRPEKWVLRILQEQTAEGFRPCADGVFEENLVVVDDRVTVFANVGGGTAPETFVFRRNAWWREGGGAADPKLPAKESDGVRGVDPVLADAGTPAMRATSKDARLRGIGAPPAAK